MNNDTGNMAERYKQELMKFYRSQEQPVGTSAEVSEPENTAQTEEAEPETDAEEIQSEDTEQSGDTAAEEDTSDMDISENFPEPDISELGTPETFRPEFITPAGMGNSEGFIMVNVRTGGDSMPIEKAAVTVTAISEGARLVIATAITDISGATLRLKVPAPDLVYSQSPDPKVRPYSLFDVNVTAQGYFNARSVDVPVFPGITSIQNFSMVPVPLYMKSTDETLTYHNQEPAL